MHLDEKTIASELAYQAKIFRVTKDTAQLENGAEVRRDVVHHSGGVCVVPLTDKNTGSKGSSFGNSCGKA